MNVLKALRKPRVRASAESTLVTSANVPNSGLTFVDNSQGCSAAVAELSSLLDVALDQFDYEGEPSDQLQLQLKRLYDEAAKYSNSHLDESIELEEWNCTRHEAEIVSTAFACAAAVYQPETIPSIPGIILEKEARIGASLGGTVKATDIYLARAVSEGPASNPLLPMIVVAVRGTASRVDRMVNLNGESKDLNLPGCVFGSQHKIHLPIFAHAGFLNGAESMIPLILKKIDEMIKKTPIKHVLFTGHSAGGAVASLIFAKALSRADIDYPSMKFSTVSFGAPPVTQPRLDIGGENSAYREHLGLVLSVANEYDLVPRADQAYIRSMVDLYRSIYGLPPIKDDVPKEELSHFVLPRLSFESRMGGVEEKKMLWSLPRPVYWHIGKIIVLKVKLAERHETKSDKDEWILRALTLTPEDFVELLFCNVDIHKRIRYQERLEMLAEGRFNGRASW